MAFPVAYSIPGIPTRAKALATAAVLDNPTTRGPNIPVLPKYALDVLAFRLDHQPIPKDITIIPTENAIIKALAVLSIILPPSSLLL
jgi:hypothetical protein